jgi:inorganic pyrophosphatase
VQSPSADDATTMSPRKRSKQGLAGLPTDADAGLNVVIETPKNQPNKFKYDPKTGAIRLSRVLPVGMVFPFDFGFVPGTKGGDGDPVDVLVLMDAPVYPGCVVEARLIGVLRCRQREDGQKEVENDRLIGVANAAMTYSAQELADLDDQLIHQIEQFFVDYNRVEGREFEVLRQAGARAARRTVDDARL